MSPVTRVKRFLKEPAQRICSHRPLNKVITWRGTRRIGQVALTFDDGPHATYTPQVLEILNQHGVVATFFLLGRNVEAHADLARRIAGAGHEIGIHGYDHTVQGLPDQTVRTRTILRRLGVETNLFRPPGGHLLLGTELWMMHHGLRTVLWSYDLRDSMRHERKTDSTAPQSPILPGDVLLMHDDNPVCTSELPSILTGLSERGLRPVTVSRLLDG